ncbi:MAG: TraR/DksA family transcriptional regulator [Alphaproteobacteria bacterium]|nr:TraR/DksA family transcriptional regulator [Alphaproteobacteria bacterium]
MDDLDRAAERIEAFNQVALHLVLSRMSGPQSSGVCRSCSDLIETERLKITPNTRFCSDCANEEEARLRRFRRNGRQ